MTEAEWNLTPSFSFSIRTFFRATFLPVCLCFALNTSLLRGEKNTENFYYSLVIAGGRYQCWTETLSLKVLHFGPRVFEFKATGVAPRDAAVAEPVTATTQNTRSSK